MPVSRQIPWQRLMVEGGVIVVSILLAFFIDAWWENEGDRKREAEVISALAEDFRDHSETIRDHVSRAQARQAGAEELFRAIGPGREVADVHIVGLINEVWNWDPVIFQGGTLEALMSGAGLSVIRDPSLRRALSDWRQEVADLEQVNTWATAHGTRFTGYLAETTSFRDLDLSSSLPPSGFETEFADLLRDVRFSNLTYSLHTVTRTVLSRLERLALAAEEVQKAIEALGGN